MLIRHVTHWYSQLPLTTLIGPIAGATIGYFVSKRRDRIERVTRQRTVAGALVAEVARIRTALGADARDHRAPDPIFYGLTFEPPRIHPWLEHVIVDAADISPNVVTDFMALERELGHFGTLLGQWREAAAAAAGAASMTATPTRVAAIAGGGGAPVSRSGATAGTAIGAVTASGGGTRERSRALYEECVATQRMAGKVLDRLEATLTPVLESPAARRAAAAAARSGPIGTNASPSAAAPAADGAGSRWRRAKTRIRRAGVTVLADFGLGDGWPEESAPQPHDE